LQPSRRWIVGARDITGDPARHIRRPGARSARPHHGGAARPATSSSYNPSSLPLAVPTLVVAGLVAFGGRRFLRRVRSPRPLASGLR
jgi:hypothetical protein